MTRPLRVGVQLPEVEREVRWPELLDMARAIEDLGFDAIWVGEHLLYRWPDREPRGPWEAWTLMAALAAVTSRVTIGPLVACTNFHNPALLAKQAATIDEVAGGRFVLGLGAGWQENEHAQYGIDLLTTGARTALPRLQQDAVEQNRGGGGVRGHAGWYAGLPSSGNPTLLSTVQICAKFVARRSIRR